mmetsp:Transcript_7991/g.22461  ORF Transcript_7991/g.22461 Transcript_7991/m.22461 type:complete len:764 (+) Transcript_7991:54-2345(+)
MATTMNAIADAIQPSALEALLTQTLADEAGLNDVAEGFKPILAYVASLASNQCVAETFHMFEWEKTCKAYLAPILADEEKCAAVTKKFMDESEKRVPKREVELDIPEGEGEILCNVEFKLAYGGKILLNTTHFHVRRGRIYGLLGHNGCGKSTLMRAISSGALAGFPGAEELMKLRACFVDHDIDGSDANTPTIDFCLQEPVLAPLGREKIREKLLEMEFTEELINKPICNLSGGWKMKLALARAVLLNADLLLLDEPTNHLDVQKQQWLCDFLTGPQCEHVTTLVVSHDSKFLNKVLSDVIHYENMRLKRYTGNLDQFVEQCPMAKAYFSIHDTEMKFTFPVPGPLEGVKSRTKAILQAKNITFTYPTPEEKALGPSCKTRSGKPTLEDVSVQVSQASRIACIGPNGAGKSTLIKCLTGEVQPTTGTVWQHPNARIGYIAQHAFHHIEQHMDKTPNEYIRWRYAGGEDREAIAKDTMKISDAELELQKTVIDFVYTDPDTAKTTKTKRVIKRLTGERKTNKSTKENDYEVQFKAPHDSDDCKHFYGYKKLVKWGWDKACKKVDVKVAQAASGMFRPLTSSNVESHLKNVGLDAEFATHHRISALSGGQKVKVVLGAAMWMQPHLVILDEPTNYLDRESLGALADAIREFEGGVVIISHNNDFTTALCPETWVVEKDEDEISRPNCRGDPEWMKNALATKCDDQQAITEVTDAYGNVTEIKAKKTLTKKEIKKMTKEIKAKIKSGAELDEDEEAFAEEHELWK